MDFSGLTNWLQGKMAGMQSFTGQDGVKYGPAVARQSRVPITYDPAQGGTMAGEYASGGLIHPEGMTIYPNSQIVKNDGSTSPTIEHEEVHALQQHGGQLGSGDKVAGYDKAAAGLPGWYNLPQETPANSIAYDPKYTPELSRSAADTYSANVIAASPPSIQGGLQSLANGARARLDQNDADLAAKVALK